MTESTLPEPSDLRKRALAAADDLTEKAEACPNMHLGRDYCELADEAAALPK